MEDRIPCGKNSGLPRIDPMFYKGYYKAILDAYKVITSFGEDSSIRSKKQLKRATEGLLEAILTDPDVRDLYMTYGDLADWRDIGLKYNPKTGEYSRSKEKSYEKESVSSMETVDD